MRWSRLLPALACVSLVGCAPRDQLTPAERSVEGETLREMVRAWARGVNSGDLDSATRFYHKGPELVSVWSEGRRTRGWEAESTATVEFLGRTTALNFDVQEPDIQLVSRRVAVAVFRHAIDLTDSLTGRQLYSGFGTLVWVKDPADNRWKIHVRQISRNPPAAQPQPTRRR